MNCCRIGKPWLIFIATVLGQLNAVADWPHFGGPGRNFQLPASVTIDQPAVQPWQIRVNGGDDCAVVAGDRVILSQADYASDGTDAHRVMCLQLATGEVVWQKIFNEKSYASQDISERYPVRPVATACIAGDRVVTVGFGGSVNCLSLSDGALIWKKDLVADFGAEPVQYGFASSPWCDGERVVVACGGKDSLLIAFRLHDGKVDWRAGSGPASYASLVDFEVRGPNPAQPSRHLIYAAGDETISVDPKSGRILWTYPYPQKGLTNAVTPVVLEDGYMVLGGQGINGSSLLQVQASEGEQFSIQEVWKNTKINPFYCNWVLDGSRTFLIGFEGKALYGMDWRTGKVLWQQRGWVDTNLVMVGDYLFATRGDGGMAKLQVDERGVTVVAASAIARDRIWAPPTIVGRRVLIRGRSSLSCVDIESLKMGDKLPRGTEVTSMDAMYGTPTEKISQLQMKAKESKGAFTFQDYLNVADDRSLQMVDEDYEGVLSELTTTAPSNLALQIAEDWSKREPNSIVAFKWVIHLLRDLGNVDRAMQLEMSRMVPVRFEVTVPENTPGDSIFLTSNATSRGKWQPDSVKLSRSGDDKYSVQLNVPRGDLQYKFTRGTWDTSEVRADGRAISNRRLRITEETTVQVAVQAWKSN